MERIIDAVGIFLCVFIAGLFVFKTNIKIKLKYQSKFYLQVGVLSFVFSYIISKLNPNNIGNTFVYLLCFVLIPFVYGNNKSAKIQQECFEEIILFCQSMSVNLKDTQNVALSLEKSKNVASSYLSDDIDKISESLSEEQEVSKKVMDEFVNKYKYSILSQLTMIMLSIHYENSENYESILDVFQQDTEQLLKDIKENQQKRKALRIQYIGLSIGCMLALWLFVRQLRSSINNIQASLSNVVLIYYLLTLVILFIVDTYFSTHISKE